MDYCNRCRSLKDICHCNIIIFDNKIADRKFVINCCLSEKYDSRYIDFTENFKNEDDLIERFVWINDIKNNQICDDCITEMIINKELIIPEVWDEYIICRPFYTSCCDMLSLEEPDDFDDNEDFLPLDPNILRFYRILKGRKFPYVSCLHIIKENPDFEGNYLKTEQVRRNSLEYESVPSNCIMCSKCLFKYPYLHSPDQQTSNLYNSLCWRSSLETHDRDIQLKKIHNELSLYIAKRNLEIINQKFNICKDLRNHILKFV